MWIKSLESRIIFLPIIRLNFQSHTINNISIVAKSHLTLIQSRHRSEQMKIPNVPHFSVADDFQAIGMKDSIQVGIQFIQFSNFSAHPHVKEDSIVQDQLVWRIECGPIRKNQF